MCNSIWFWWTALHFKDLSVLHWLGCVCRKHPGNLSLPCPELILPGVRHEIGFRKGGVLQVCPLSATLECHFNKHTKFMLKPRWSPSESNSLSTSDLGTAHYSGRPWNDLYKEMYETIEPVNMPHKHMMWLTFDTDICKRLDLQY